MADSPGVGHTDSIDSHDSSKGNEKKKSKRPANTAFRQQRLKAWQPILTPKTVLPLFFAIGVIFAPIGGLLLYASSQVQELRLDYSDCVKNAPTDSFALMESKDVTASFKSTNGSIDAQWKRRDNVSHIYVADHAINVTRCTLQFNIPSDMQPPVLFYYHLTNFYQNHRKYVNSFYDKQLKGDDVTAASVKDSSCSPLAAQTFPNNDTVIPYYPCGLIANSMFNDTFDPPLALNVAGSSNANETYSMSETGIAWSTDKDLFGNINSNTDLDSIQPPPNWQIRYPNNKYSEDAPPPNLGTDEHFMVWMRTAGLPSFSKLYMRNDTAAMKQGTYQIDIISNFPTDVYQGRKSIIITTKTVMGGKNIFLGIAYIVVGGICIILGAIFTVTHMVKPRKLGDHTYLSWNNTTGPAKAPAGPSVGMSTGRDLE
ncbi:CDC50 family protein [Pseudomassariella vexata]|uniref:CDC50 family protein n=1 Tax=Pseudomassariella vexata TaxID=1141098 RepID=A0A1Y2DDD1_9PEZI|nr:CDC50 family protein [Pseudomassariella vexata]ORY57249.1 CDC50 family protein [Pseudomassariella vexata]